MWLFSKGLGFSIIVGLFFQTLNITTSSLTERYTKQGSTHWTLREEEKQRASV